MTTPHRRRTNPQSRTRSRTTQVVLGPALILITVGASACSGPTTTEHPAPSTTATGDAAPSPAATGRLGGVTEAAVLDAYRRFWTVAVEVGRLPAGRWRIRLEPVATDPFLSELLDGLAEQRERGAVDFGAIQLRPTIATLTPTRASVLDCQDASRSGEADRATGAVLSVGSSRTAFTATLTRDAAGRWKVTHARYLRDPC